MTSRHGVADRVLHRLALQSRWVREFCFSRECAQNGRAADQHRRNVFIAGVARAGSTALLDALHASGDFAATTYALMPFVLAPSLARRTAWIPRRPVAAAERAHGDRLRVSHASAEALDGIFWSTFMPPAGDRLTPHAVPEKILRQYACFIENLLAQSAARRYLGKMNQNVDKLAALADYFDRSQFLLPYRAPLAQAASLARQHRNFARLSGYERRYFEWLGHHEFGVAHRPFVPPEGASPDRSPSEISPPAARDGIDYWLRQWHATYGYLADLAERRANLVPVCYERLATSATTWAQLSRRLDTEVDGKAFIARDAAAPETAGADAALLKRCEDLYARLARLSEARLCAAP